MCGDKFVAQALEPAADAPVRAEGPDLEHDAADQARIDAACRLDGTSRCLLDRADDGRRVFVRELDSSLELDRQPVLSLVYERLELPLDLGQLAGAALLRDEPDEVANEV